MPLWDKWFRRKDELSRTLEKLETEFNRLYEQGNHQEAKSTAKQALQVAKRQLDPHDPVIAAWQCNLGIAYAKGRFPTLAESAFKQAIKIYRLYPERCDEDLRAVMHQLVVLQKSEGTMPGTSTASDMSQVAVTGVSTLIDDPNNRDPFGAMSVNELVIAQSAFQMAKQLHGEGDFAQAEHLYNHVLEQRRRALGETDPLVAQVWASLGALYRATGKFEQAEDVLHRSLGIFRQTVGARSDEYAGNLNNLGTLYMTRGNFVQAEHHWREAAEILSSSGGEGKMLLGSIFSNLTFLYERVGDNIRALEMSREAAVLLGSTVGELHAHYAHNCMARARLYASQGELIQAEHLLQRAVEILHQTVGEHSEGYLAARQNLAGLYAEMGRVKKAIQIFDEQVQKCHKTHGAKHVAVAAVLYGLALLYTDLRDYSQALELLTEVLEIRLSVWGEFHPDVANTLHNLGTVYMDLHDYKQAWPLLIQASSIRIHLFGKNHIDVANSLFYYAAIGCELGHYAEAVDVLTQTADIIRTIGMEKSVKMAWVLALSAHAYAGMLKYSNAISLMSNAVSITGAALGDIHPRTASNLADLASYHIASRQENEGVRLMKQAMAVEQTAIANIMSITTERQRTAYLTSERRNLCRFLSLVVKFRSTYPSMVNEALDVVLRRKAIGVDALAVQREVILRGRYPHLESELRQLNALRGQISQKKLSGPGPEGVVLHNQLISDWSKERQQLEARLVRAIPEMSLQQQLDGVDRQKIARQLPRTAAFIEFIRTDMFNFTPAPGQSRFEPARYLAFILANDRPDDVKLVDLGEAERIEQLVSDFREAVMGLRKAPSGETGRVIKFFDPALRSLQDPDVLRNQITCAASPSKLMRDVTGIQAEPEYDEMRNIGGKLRQVLWDPIAAELGDVKECIIGPDGALTLLPFEVLPLYGNHFLIDEYNLSYVSVGREILGFGVTVGDGPGEPLVVANPNFNLRHDAVQAPMETFAGLSGTAVEGNRIGKLLHVSPLLADAVLEATVKCTRSPAILHLATHGFFIPVPADGPTITMEAMLPQEINERASGIGRLAGEKDPLLRSGLALAGANTWLSGGEMPAEAEDGVLLAEDVTGIDLLNTELVVLSACETGLGDVHVGEGVFGLRRAFMLSGAKTLVMSLWKVPDRATQELMVDFYERLLRGEPRAAALSQAQRELKKRYRHPRDWGGFICQGDQSPLPDHVLDVIRQRNQSVKENE